MADKGSLFQRLRRREAGHADQRHRRSCAPAIAFGDQRIFEEVDEALLGLDGPRCQRGEAFHNAGELELLAERRHPVRLQSLPRA